MVVEVIKAYVSAYPNPIAFATGEPVQVMRGDSEFPGWFWSLARNDIEGWVHHSFLSATSGEAAALRDYSARELTATVGEHGTVMENLDGWAWLRLGDGREGWIPESHLRLGVS
jgi:SH3-like domain-containing protein